MSRQPELIGGEPYSATIHWNAGDDEFIGVTVRPPFVASQDFLDLEAESSTIGETPIRLELRASTQSATFVRVENLHPDEGAFDQVQVARVIGGLIETLNQIESGRLDTL